MKARIKKFADEHPRFKAFLEDLRWKRHILSDWANTVLFRRKVQVRTPFGFTLVSRNYNANRLMLEGTFETAEFDLILRQIQATDVFVDVGANIGYYTCLARHFGKPAVAFEPQPQNLECLFENLERNGWAETEVLALGLSRGPGLMKLYGASGPSASLVRGWAGYPSFFQRVIPVNSLDNLLAGRFTGQRLLVKIDVEGAEFDVLQGASALLARTPHPTWFLEICLGEYHPGRPNPHFAETFELFWRHGYEARVADSTGRLVTPEDVDRWTAAGTTGTQNLNYLFTHPSG